MKANSSKLAAVSAIALIAGCTEFTDIDSGAGASITTAFGAATTSNTLVQSVNLSSGVLADLQSQFRAAAPDQINFAFNEATLDEEARAALDKQAAWIRVNPAIKLRIYGHTDLVGSNAYNQRLGLRRARAAVNYLRAAGVRKGQVEAVASFGETRPLVNTQNRERLNRRTVTEVVGFDANYRGFDFDGKVANNIYNSYTTSGTDAGGGEE